MRQPRTSAAIVISAAAARTYVARALLRSPNDAGARLGDVTLLQYQVDGAARVQRILERHGGALLADEVGLGKTYTALGVAREFRRVEVVAPAALRSMWHEACARCAIATSFVSTESLSRSNPVDDAPDLVIVDEAHWFRNAATQRYRRLARRCRSASVLLLSATPLHNREADLVTLLALFLGARAARRACGDISEFCVRRARHNVAMQLTRAPAAVLPTTWWRVGCDQRVVAALDALDAPVPPRDGGLALALLRLTLTRRLSSSNAALRATLRRMLARALALLAAARAGSHPTARELCGWIVADEAIQLELSGLTGRTPNESLPIAAIERHIATVRAALQILEASPNNDRKRASALQTLLKRFASAKIVAFSQYDATVRALARELRAVPGIATLSAKGARITSGTVSRGELLRQFDAGRSPPSVHRAINVRLLLTTDLLSEGVNLHNAQVVVHLDVPWTTARLEQRVGRLSRIGATHKEIHAFGFAPPIALEKAQRVVSRIRAKSEAARRRFGESVLVAGDALVRHANSGESSGASTRDQEALLELLTDWLGDAPPDVPIPFVAHVSVAAHGPLALALMNTPHGPRLAALELTRPISMRPYVVLRVARLLANTPEIPSSDGDAYTALFVRFGRYLARRRAADAMSIALGRAAMALQTRVALATKSAMRNRRPRALELAAAIRSVLQRVSSAGDHALLNEHAISLLARPRNGDPLQWLEETDALLRASFPEHIRHRANESAPYGLIGMLIST